jgi:hypothetical protein
MKIRRSRLVKKILIIKRKICILIVQFNLTRQVNNSESILLLTTMLIQ